MIRTFRDRETERISGGGRSRRRPLSIQATAFRKLRLLDAATELEELKTSPGNRLEALADDRAGQHSIRINDQWRLCFYWTDGGADDVEIVDYHR